MTAELIGSTPIKEPAPIAGNAVTKNKATLLKITSFVIFKFIKNLSRVFAQVLVLILYLEFALS
jgi:hypothetical protein